ncbi:MAG: hypothetical protein Q7K54_05755 [Candidatus Parcubacteria bacterium]|nr:hypothetical protein [Candidatus Parcubacteria bacterium]
MNKKFLLACLGLTFFLILFSFNKINLPTADIGRHIVNGDAFLHSASYGISKTELLHTNLFSYTHPDFPFINHHWGSGILIYLTYILFGFSGLSLIYFLLILGAFIFVFILMRDDADLDVLFLTSIFLIPLIAGRTEVRPEGLSYFFLAFFTYILYRYSKNPEGKNTSYGAGKIPEKILWLLPISELIWVNTHIYFIFGPFLIGMFLGEEIILRNWQKVKKLSLILGASIIAMFISPYGLKGTLYPFTIFQNYGYRIVENQSISFLENISFINPEFLWYKITLFFVLATSLFVIIKYREKFLWTLTGISLTFAVLAYLGIRHIPAFALFSLPLLVYNLTIIKKILQEKIKINIDPEWQKILYGLFFVIIISITMVHFSTKLPWNKNFGLGIDQNTLAPIEFIKNNNIHGPFFNNYDIGGFMIFGLYPARNASGIADAGGPKEKVFVDNRPEAYPKEFFENIYIPMQEDDKVWQEENKKEKFNAIFFQRLDYTPWAQKFLLERIKDPLWAPVFVDSQTIIFLSRNKENVEIIKKYELPKNMFQTK